MTSSEKDTTNLSDGQMEKLNQNSSIQRHISNRVNDLFSAKSNDFSYNEEVETDDLDQLADNLFDALYDHTNK